MEKIYKVIGVMSGTSLDGIDLCYCQFEHIDEKWHFEIKKSTTIPYTQSWFQQLDQACYASALDLIKLDHDYGSLIGQTVLEFITKHNLQPDFIASHGHTVFHQPKHHYTLQIGKGSHIVKEVQIPVINDFRILDMAYGGQGAPLVPVGDELLFSQYDYCVNLGGFANLSFQDNSGKRVAYDVCPCNMPLNILSQELGKSYDKNGLFAKKGTVNHPLLNQLNDLPFYTRKGAKSLGKEWFESDFFPIIQSFDLSVYDKLATVTAHIAHQLSQSIIKKENTKVLLTGGGAFNHYLISLLKHHHKADFVIPDKEIVNYKEALIFAFLGVLRFRNEINIYHSVTGSEKDTSSGVIWYP